jgi:rare lipoprotein A
MVIASPAGAGRAAAGVLGALSSLIWPGGRTARIGSALFMAGMTLAGCAQAPEPVAHHRYHGKEHFAEGFYGKASPRMAEDGDPIPRGGGQYLVGRPYHIAGRTYYPREDEHYVATGIASWYGDAFHGRKTANGEVYDKMALSAAHPTMPLPSYARVTNLANGYSIIVRVNDRGPYAAGRVMDVSSRVADVLDFKRMGTAHVKVEYVGRAPLEGSDDDQLLASLRTDGGPASIGGAPTLVAETASPLLSLFGSKSEPPPPPAPPPPPPSVEAADDAPPPPPPVKPRRAERAPEPETAVAQTDDAAPAPRPRVQKAAMDSDDDGETTVAAARAAAPLPPARPYDLGVREANAAPKPPRRHDRALYFAPPAHEDALARLVRRRPTRPLRDDDDDN